MTRSFQLDYDESTRTLTLSAGSTEPAWIQVSEDVSVALDTKKKQLVALRISDFPWFVDYHLIAKLLGPEVVTPLSQFQSDVVDRHEKGAKRIDAPVRREERKLVDAGSVMGYLA